MALIEFKDLPDTSTPINADNLNKIQESNVYSTDEIEIGKDINNKPIYRKVIEATLDLSSSGIHNINIGLSNIKDVYDIKYRLIAGTRKLVFNDAISAIGIDISTNYLYIYTGINWDNSIEFRFIVEYTKTTD